MYRFKISVRQWLEQTSSAEFEAETRTDAWNQAVQKTDWNWANGSATTNFEIIAVEELPPVEGSR
jgi:hypothetical protein